LKIKACKIQRLVFVSVKLRLGIARGRSCASVLVALVEALHGRAAMAKLKLHGWQWELAERGRGVGGEEQRAQLCVERRKGVGGIWEWLHGEGSSALLFMLCIPLRGEEEIEKREETRKGRKKERKKKLENIPNLKIFREKNKK
jgi:hypothetical protein